MWLCGPIAGLVVQPCVGLWSDRCYSKFGRRRPFILIGCLLICTAVTVIGFSSDIGYALGDTKEHCSLYHGPRWKAAIFFVAGFWLLDFSNNAVQGPTRALMADLSGKHGCSSANAIFCFWVALGNTLGYSSGAFGEWHRLFPFLQTKACCQACANLKGAFLVAAVVLILCLIVTLNVAKEAPLQHYENEDEAPCGNSEGQRFTRIINLFTELPNGMHAVITVMALTSLSWFPFILYDTDWMGREIYHGNPSGTQAEISSYNAGVRLGTLGLLWNSVVMGISSFLIEPMCQKLTPKIVWVMSNFTIFLAMTAVAILGSLSINGYSSLVEQVVEIDGRVKAAALALFAVLGFPSAVLFSVPFAYVAQLAAYNRGGQGFCIGVLNISIVIPQVIIALIAGPWDSLFGKGNTPAFALASAIAFVCGFIGLLLLPTLPRSQFMYERIGVH